MKYIASVVLAYLLIGCGPYQPEEKVTIVNKDSVDAAEAARHIMARYEGLLPCADCGGINTVLTLREDGKYLLEERFTGTNDMIEKTFTHEGKYITIKGTEKDSNAVIYQLLFDAKEDTRNYLVINNKSIKLVDPKQNEFDTNLNYILTKKKIRKS